MVDNVTFVMALIVAAAGCCDYVVVVVAVSVVVVANCCYSYCFRLRRCDFACKDLCSCDLFAAVCFAVVTLVVLLSDFR